MHIQINTDKNITSEGFDQPRVEEIIQRAMKRFSAQMTRLEVHLTDENSGAKSGVDKRCLLEARLAGCDPISVHATDISVERATISAVKKLERLLESKLGKLGNH